MPACAWPSAWALRSSMSVVTGSRPAFSARVRGMISKAEAKASMAICSRPPTVSAKVRRSRERAARTLPPPVRTAPSSQATETTPTASSKARRISSTTCSVPPRRSTETDFASGQPVMNVMSESPIFFSSTRAAIPRSLLLMSSRFVIMVPPVALPKASMSDFLARRIAKMPFLER